MRVELKVAESVEECAGAEIGTMRLGVLTSGSGSGTVVVPSVASSIACAGPGHRTSVLEVRMPARQPRGLGDAGMIPQTAGSIQGTCGGRSEAETAATNMERRRPASAAGTFGGTVGMGIEYTMVRSSRRSSASTVSVTSDTASSTRTAGATPMIRAQPSRRAEAPAAKPGRPCGPARLAPGASWRRAPTV
jgi:hypothetical protein